MSESQRVVLLSEGTSEIGSGHIVEMGGLFQAATWSCLEAVGYAHVDPDLAPIADWARPLSSVEPDVLSRLGEDPCAEGARIAVTNFRSVSEEQIQALRNWAGCVVCIDELGGRTINPDVIISTSIVRSFHDYPGSTAEVFAGAEFLSLNERFQRLRLEERAFDAGVRKIVVSMGGVDRLRTTMRVLESLSDEESLQVDVVIGPGFEFGDEVLEFARPRSHIHPHVCPPELSDFLLDSDMGITAGGNTLYEMACVGTPAVVLYEDEHERLQGEEFERRGFGICAGNGLNTSLEVIRSSIKVLDDPCVLSRHSRTGKQIVPGDGCQRTLDIVRQQLLSRGV